MSVSAQWAWLLAFGGLLAAPASAAVFLVDTTSDDGSPAFSTCDGEAGNGDCSLRGAINAANAAQGPHVIVFALDSNDPGYVTETQHWRFAPASAYPAITRDVVIDGYTQAGAFANTQTPDQGGSNAVLKIELRGATPNLDSGLSVVDGGLTVRGLAISGFQRKIMLLSMGQHRVEGCFIGTDITGMNAGGSITGAGTGIQIRGQVTIGGTDPAARNVISGNAYQGVWSWSSGEFTIQGNVIGLNATGTAVIPGQDYGIMLNESSLGSVIGGTAPAARNVISGHDFSALYMSTGSALPSGGMRTRVIGNYFGTDVDGNAGFGNGTNSASPSQPQPTLHAFGSGACGIGFGGDAPGEGNLIASSGGPAILISSCIEAPLIGNRFLRNRGMAVDLSTASFANGATPNDPDDADGAPGSLAGNRLQNVPEILSLTPLNGGSDVELTYRVDTAPAHAAWPLRIAVAIGRGNQPETWIATDTYDVTDAQQPKTIVIPVASLSDGALILSATDAAGNSSEFGGDTLLFSDFE